MKLKELLAGLEIRSAAADMEMEIAGVCYDSRQVRSGDLFVALSGYTVDGHRFIPQARAAGAAGMVGGQILDMAGEGRALAAALGVPFCPCSHQQGHVAAAAWSAGREDLLDKPHLAWHLSGGTTELLRVEPEGHTVRAEVVGGTSDIAAGQLVDRAGVLLGLPFPAGKALDALYPEAGDIGFFRVKLNGLTFSLSGMENKVKELAEKGETPANIARFTIDTILNVLVRATREAQKKWSGLPVLCSGGVASNRQSRAAMERECGSVFAQPQYATDNALGVAILTHRALERGAAG